MAGEMVERVATAYANAWSADIKTYLNTDVPVWDQMGEGQRAAMIRVTRAAMEAMREPTEAMKTAAFGPILNGGRTGPITSDQIRREASLSVYRAMIDEALK